MMTKISELINKNHQKRVKIAVFGDCMIDEYYKVKVKRISPESPVPVMLSETDKPSYVLPGGAANVAAQFKHWNVDCTLFGLMSCQDAEIYKLHGITVAKKEQYLETGCEGYWRYIYNVPRKKRFVDGQNLIRWDVERDYGVEIEEVDDLIALFEYHLKNHGFDVVIFADYDKGVFKDFDRTRRLINLCHEHKVPSIVDPKDEPIDKWCGCTYFKPNSVEAEKFTGVHDEDSQVFKLSQRLPRSNIVITNGGNGVACVDEGEKSYPRLTSFNKDVPIKNFSGAGDCFVAFFALGIVHKFRLYDAVEIAFEAGKVYVQREYNKPLIPLDLYNTKFVNTRDLKNRDFKLVATNGVFDLIHNAHISTFEFAKSKGDKLIVLVNSDDSVKRLKGNDRPIMGLNERMKMIASLECVDYVVSFDEDTPYDIIKEIQPDVLVKGADYKNKKVNSSELVKELYFAPFIDGISTTKIIEKIRKS